MQLSCKNKSKCIFYPFPREGFYFLNFSPNWKLKFQDQHRSCCKQTQNVSRQTGEAGAGTEPWAPVLAVAWVRGSHVPPGPGPDCGRPAPGGERPGESFEFKPGTLLYREPGNPSAEVSSLPRRLLF